jgi:branched-chain amino acid transport system ATP-binding protein
MLELENVVASYGDARALFGISLYVKQGEVVTLLGRNGAGKSTTLKSIVGLVAVNRGTISFEGQNITKLQTHRIARLGVGYVPEDRRIFPQLSVEENLRVTRRFQSGPNSWPLDRVYSIFPKLAELRQNTGGLLSGGEQQMLCIARTLTGNPKLLLLDEPSEGLAPLIIQLLIEQIGLLKGEGLTILLSEQNMNFARSLSDRVYVIDRGTIVFKGTFDTLDANKAVRDQHLFVATPSKPLRAAEPLADGDQSRKRGMP